MKKLVLLFLILVHAVSCEKKQSENEPVIESTSKAEIVFEIPSNLIASERVTLKSLSFLDTSVVFEDGLLLDSDKRVSVQVEPFQVPSGGFTVSFQTSDGRSFSSTVLSGPDDGGFNVCAGEIIEIYVPSADSFLPCSFPVIFPLGLNPAARTGYFNYSDDQPEWSNSGIWRCYAQKQVYATWNKVSDPDPRFRQKRELLNTRDIGTIGLKGIWTGDYFEFVFPVEGIQAGSTVSFEAPFYGRQQPVFWTVSWFEGGQWKKDLHDVVSHDGSVTLKASFATALQGVEIRYSFKLEEAIEHGELKVRIECTDGRYQADTSNGKIVKRDLPYNNGNEYFSPFYFYCEGSDIKSFTWNINQ